MAVDHVTTGHAPLSEALLERCRERAAIYDGENRFFTRDFEEQRPSRSPPDAALIAIAHGTTTGVR